MRPTVLGVIQLRLSLSIVKHTFTVHNNTMSPKWHAYLIPDKDDEIVYQQAIWVSQIYTINRQ